MPSTNDKTNKTCGTCRFANTSKCVKFGIIIQENYKACNDYADAKPLNESTNNGRIQLCD